MLKIKIPWQLVRRFLGILIGATTVAISINTFILSNHIADGGVTGIAILLYYIFHWDIGLIVIILNIPLFILGYRAIGRQLFYWSILGVVTMSAGLKLTSFLTPLTTNTLLAAVFGGVVSGIGMGLIFRCRGSLGGTDILAIVLNKKTQFSVGQIILVLDAVIFIGAAILFNAETAMYAMIYMFIASKVIDLVQVGLDYSKSVMIITEKPDQIAAEIIDFVDRGATFFHAEGAFSNAPKKVIYSIVNRAQLTQIKEIVHRHDPDAFVAIGDVSEVVGEGFKSWKGH